MQSINLSVSIYFSIINKTQASSLSEGVSCTRFRDPTATECHLFQDFLVLHFFLITTCVPLQCKCLPSLLILILIQYNSWFYYHSSFSFFNAEQTDVGRTVRARILRQRRRHHTVRRCRRLCRCAGDGSWPGCQLPDPQRATCTWGLWPVRWP